ncbi:MAG: enoyl-CoA hydratase/isomerase family protein [Acidobacteriota bacterium]
MEHQFILAEPRGAILTLTLNNPQKSNSLHPELVDELVAKLKAIKNDEAINVVIITGAGKHFCAGLDLNMLVDWTKKETNKYLQTVTKIFRRIWRLPQPVIAAVNGAAIAGGFDLAAFCDIRLAAHEAIFGQAEINIGLTQIIHPLYKTIGLANAKELAMTGQNITAAEAYRIGLVNHLCEREALMNEAMKLAEILAAKPRAALFETKRLTRELIDLDMKTAQKRINASIARCLKSEEHRQKVAEVLEKIKAKQ